MAKAMKAPKTPLQVLFEHTLMDMYYAESRIQKALPKVMKAAKSAQLKAALKAHHKHTGGHIRSLKSMFGKLGLKPKAVKCDAIDGILKETDGIIRDFSKSPAVDAAVAYAWQAVEHYEVTRYGTMRRWAMTLGKPDLVKVLTQMRDQEGAADEKLTELAVASLNPAANEAKKPAAKKAGRKPAKRRLSKKRKL